MTLPEPYYQDDSCTIYHGDCREILPSLDAHIMVTDPPYGIAYATNHTVGGVGASWIGTEIVGDGDVGVRDAVLRMWGERPAIVFGTWKVAKPYGTHTVLVWDKGPASGMGDLSIPWKPSWEEIYILGRDFVGRRDEGVLKGHTVLTWESKGRCHPNEKPVSLLRALMQKLPPLGAVVDPFMGSGTTLRAAKDLGRKAIGIEIEERYCEIAAKRLSQMVLPLQVA
jgi:DNA modification methylase